MSDRIEELVYDEARRGLDLQRDGLDALRTRAGTLLAAASLVTTFLGGQALEGNRDVTGLGWLAIGAFIGAAALTFVVLLPWKFEFTLEGPQMVDDYVDQSPQPAPATVLRDFALFHAESRTNNKPRMTTLQWSFRLAVGLLAVEVVAWLLAL